MFHEIELFRGDITKLAVDAIVNAANAQLTPGGAAGLAIHAAAGPELKAECMKITRACHAGDAVITGAYRLSAKYVIHAVGPSWHGDDKGESELLARAYRRSFALAEEHDVRSIAFPAISCGLYSFPAAIAARIAVREANAALARRGSVRRVIFALFTDAVYNAFADALAEAGLDAGMRSARLTLTPATTALLRADLAGRAELEEALGAAVPESWPPEYYDEGAIAWVLQKLADDPGSQWYFHYFIHRETATVIGAGGYKGPPADGVIEVGYSILPEHRRRGYATEATRALIEHARQHAGVTRVIAHTFPDLAGSIGVLEKLGFVLAGSGEEEGTIRYELPILRQAARHN